MRVVGVDPSRESVIIVVVDYAASKITVSYKDEWKMSGTNRSQWYAEVRTRFMERLRDVKPACVSIAPVESQGLRHARFSWFETAELRGVVAEASHSAGVVSEMRSKSDITRSLHPPKKKGDPKLRPASEFEKDDAFWLSILTSALEKKYRPAALLAYSRALEQ